MALSRTLLFCLAALVISGQAGAAVPIPPRAAADSIAEQVMLDALLCVGAVLTYRTAEGKETCGRLIAALPNEVLGYKYRGLAYLLEHDFPKAEADFGVAVRLDADDPENQAGYAQSLSGEGRYAEAIPFFDQALRLDPDDIRFLAARCWARGGEGSDLERAVADCDRALTLAPGFSTALQNRGTVHLKAGRFAAAIEDFSRALALAPGGPAILYGRGLAYLQSGDRLRAGNDIQAARELDPTIDNLFIRLGILPASCREDAGECPLPPDLRRPPPPAAGPILTISYTPGRAAQTGLPDVVDVIALGRMDIMLWDTSLLLGVPLREEEMESDDASFAGMRRHLAKLQKEYQRQQGLACDTQFLAGYLCRPADFQRVYPGRGNSVSAQIERTIDVIYPFWVAMCRRHADGARACQIE